jgi:hypothetical protein
MDTTAAEQGLTYDEMVARYPTEWLVVRATERDEAGWLTRGILVAHDKRRRALRETIFQEIDRCKREGRGISVFRAEERLPWGPEAMARWDAMLWETINDNGKAHG